MRGWVAEKVGGLEGGGGAILAMRMSHLMIPGMFSCMISSINLPRIKAISVSPHDGATAKEGLERE